LPYWTAILEQLPVGVATAHDTQIVMQLCQALHLQATAWRQIIDDGIETVDAAHGGDKRRNPAIITWRQAADMALQCMNLLGLSPVSRARIKAADAERADPFLEYLRQRHGPRAPQEDAG
jgi:P27 family predicted phage terminase small subunit